MKQISEAGNTVVPALLTLERLGFSISVVTCRDSKLFRVTRGEERFVGHDPLAILGLVKLVEARGSEWQPTDTEILEVLTKYQLE